MSEKDGASSDEGNVPLKEAFKDSSSDKKTVSKKKKKSEKSSKKDTSSVEISDESTSTKKNESEKSKSRRRSKYYVEVDEEDDKRAVPLLDQPPVVEGSRQRRKVIPLNLKPEVLKHGAIPIPDGRGVALGRIPTFTSRFKRLRLDEIKVLHRFMFGKLGDLNYLNNNIISFNGFAFTKDSTEYAKKLVILGKMHISILREFLLLFDLDLKIRKKEDTIKTILDFLLCPQRSETTVNPNIVSHPKRRATKRNYFEREIEDEEKKTRRVQPSKTKENEVTEETAETSAVKNSAKGKEEEKTQDEEFKENNSGADNTNELKKPAKKRKRNQVIIEEQAEKTVESKAKKSKSKESNNGSAVNDDDIEANTTEDLSDDELKSFLKKVLADANLEKTTMKTVYSLISEHYPNYNFSKKKDFIKEVVKSAIQT